MFSSTFRDYVVSNFSSNYNASSILSNNMVSTFSNNDKFLTVKGNIGKFAPSVGG